MIGLPLFHGMSQTDSNKWSGTIYNADVQRRGLDALSPLKNKRPTYPRLQSLAARSRSALPTTLTDDSAMAAAATIGDNSRPKSG